MDTLENSMRTQHILHDKKDMKVMADRWNVTVQNNVFIKLTND